MRVVEGRYLTATDAVRDYARLGHDRTLALARALPMGVLKERPDAGTELRDVWSPLLTEMARRGARAARLPMVPGGTRVRYSGPRRDINDPQDGCLAADAKLRDPRPGRDSRSVTLSIVVWSEWLPHDFGDQPTTSPNPLRWPRVCVALSDLIESRTVDVRSTSAAARELARHLRDPGSPLLVRDDPDIIWRGPDRDGPELL